MTAEQRDAEAQFELGVRYYTGGAGVPERYASAVYWLRLAAEQGTAYAQYNLGVAYFTGRGISKDDIQAYAWVNLAVDEITENLNAKEKHKVRLFQGSIASELSSDDIRRAKKLSREYSDRIYGLGSDTVE